MMQKKSVRFIEILTLLESIFSENIVLVQKPIICCPL